MSRLNMYQSILAGEMANAGIIKKALETGDVSSHGGLKEEAANKFIDLVVNESALLQNIRVHRTDKPAGIMAKLNVTGPITYGVAEGSTPATTSKPVASSVEYVTKKTVSLIDITGEFTEDNIEGASGRSTILGMMTKQIGNDMESLALEGDEAISGSEPEDLLYKTNNGFIKLTAAGSGAHLINCGGANVGDTGMELLYTMLRSMPNKYKKDLSKLRWIMSENTRLDLAAMLMSKGGSLGGALAGSAFTEGQLPATILGVKPLVVPLMPENLTVGGEDDGTCIFLTDPRNLVYVVQRDLSIEWERVPRGDKWEATIHMRSDFIIENTDAVVRTKDLKVGFANEGDEVGT